MSLKAHECLCRLQRFCSRVPTPFIPSGCKRRFLSSSNSSSIDNDDVSVKLREVMRNVPQPVAIVTALNTSPASKSTYHGATLTSFTSLTLHPQPLVAFSLRLPSRLADCLRISSPVFGIPIPQSLPKSSPTRIPLTVSLLSRVNRPIADALSSRLPDQSGIFSRPEWEDSDGRDRPPALRGAIGALRCEVVSSIPLRDVCDAGVSEGGDAELKHSGGTRTRQGEIQSEGSELFICRVLDVASGDEGILKPEPLLHLKQTYVGVKSIEEDLDSRSEPDTASK